MRVLTIVEDLGPGGMQRVAQNYAAGYARGGFPSAVLTYLGGGPREAALARAGLGTFVGSNTAGDLAQALERAIEWRPNVLHVHRYGHPDPPTASILRTLRGSLPGRVCVIETNVMGKVDYSPDRSLIDVHMPLTRWALWKWGRWSRGLRPQPVAVLMPNLIETDAFRPITESERASYRTAAGIPVDAFLFGGLGQPVDEKWSPLMFEAFREVAERHSEAYLLLTGVPPRYQQAIRRLPAPVRSRVVELPFTNADDELRLRYGAVDVFVHASAIGESFGLAVAEAMLAERPVVTLSVPARGNGHVEVVGHERGGLVVNDAGTMVEAMQRLISDRSLGARLGRMGAASIRERYDLESKMPLLVRIAHAALEATDREELRRSLAADPELLTAVPDTEVKSLLEASLGSPSLKARLLMRLVHVGWLYRLFSRIRYR
jgi:glycosyltransferase involved in cell wall biosynthesis